MFRRTLIFLFFYTFPAEKLSLRTKRTLLWQKGTINPSMLQVIVGIGIPVDFTQQSVTSSACFNLNYMLPTNVSELKPFQTVEQKRKKRSLSRWDIYELLGQLWQQRGYGGKSCILRVICELSHRPVDKTSGLFSELVHAVFTPSRTNEILRHYSDNEYLAAQKFGKAMGNFCESKFSDCGSDIVNMFTM